MIFNFTTKQFELSDEDQGAIMRAAAEMGVATGYIATKLANIYGANLADDLVWIAEMYEEDQANASVE